MKFIKDENKVKIASNFAASSLNYYLILSKRGDKYVFPRNKVIFLILTAYYDFPVVLNSGTCFVPVLIILAVVFTGIFFDR